jgi:RND family efflux transporter MFP subunit
VEESKVFLDYATITAPFSGIVVDKQVEPGDTATPGQTLLTLYDPDQMQLVANVRESLALKLKVGQQLPAKLEAFDYTCNATVREVVPQADAASRSFQVKVSGPCPPGIYSGMFGRLMLPLGDETLVVIPAGAVSRVGQLTLVEVVEGDELVRRHIQLGRQLDGNYEVLSGLKAGERIVVGYPNTATTAAETLLESN